MHTSSKQIPNSENINANSTDVYVNRMFDSPLYAFAPRALHQRKLLFSMDDKRIWVCRTEVKQA